MKWFAENWEWIVGIYAALTMVVAVYRRKENEIKTFVLSTEWSGDDVAFKVVAVGMKYLSFLLDVVAWFVPGIAAQRTAGGAMANDALRRKP